MTNRRTRRADYDPTLKDDLVHAFESAVLDLTRRGQMDEVVDAAVKFLIISVTLLQQRQREGGFHRPAMEAFVEKVNDAVARALDGGAPTP